MRERYPQAMVGMALAAVCAGLFADWALNAGPLTPAAIRESALVASSSMVTDRFAPEVAQRFRMALAVSALLGCGVAAFIFHRAPASPPARQVAWLLVGYAAYTFLTHFAGVDARYRHAALPRSVLSAVSFAMLVGLVLAATRFLGIFPRPVDAESAWRSYWLRRVHGGDVARYPILTRWHEALQRGTPLWMVPGAILAVAALSPLLDTPAYSWLGVHVVLIGAGAIFLAFVGIPFAFASTTHLYRNGSADERRRVAWLRGLLLLTAVVVALLLAGSIGVPMWLRNDPGTRPLSVAGAFIMAWVLLPNAFILALAFTVLYRGALDPRIAVSRATVWTLLGFTITAVFVLVERFVAVKAVQWLGLPTETGLVVAGAVIASTFLPLRRAADRAVVRLADRFLPISVVADGARVVRVVAITDLSGYTALSARDEGGALMQGALLKRLGERVSAAHRGRMVKSMGDAVMLTFGSAADALAAVRALHRDYAEAARALGLEPLPLHSSLHRGEIVESHDGDIYGQTVNVAVRLVDAAAPGEIVVSQPVRGELADAACVDIGARKFKNVPQAMRCFRIAEESTA